MTIAIIDFLRCLCRKVTWVAMVTSGYHFISVNRLLHAWQLHAWQLPALSAPPKFPPP